MELKANFPSSIPEPTEEELTEVLAEFYQRGQSEKKSLAPPVPIEVTSSVVQTHSSQLEPTKRDVPPLVLQDHAFVRPETEFEIIPLALYGTVTFVLDFYLRCHNSGTIGSESYIRLYPGSFWRSVTPPGFSGGVAFAFSGSTWTPPANDTQGTFVRMWITPLNIPPAPNYIYEGHLFFAIYLQEAAPPYHISDAIYATSNLQNLTWYHADNGIGADIVFHTNL